MSDQTSSLPFVDVPGGVTEGGQSFPGLLSPVGLQDRDAMTQWVSANRRALLDAMTSFGAIVLRGLPVCSPDDFDAVIGALELENFPYRKSLSNAVRRVWTDRVFSANEAPPAVKILFHHEMAQTPIYPEQIFFACLRTPDKGGATPLCRSDWLLERLSESRPEFVSCIEQFGLKYSNVMPSDDDHQSGMGRSWRSTLGVQSRVNAEARLSELNYSWEWLDDDSLRVCTPTLPGVMQLPDGRRTFFNQLIAAFAGWKDTRNDPSKAVRLGNNQALDVESAEDAFRIAEEICFDLQWIESDVALVDNRIVMHARRPFEGTRSVLASLASAKSNAFASTSQ